MNRIAFPLLVFLLKAISLLPFRLLYLVSDFLFWLLYHVIKYRRKVVQTNLSNAFPEKSSPERAEIEKKFYRFLADMIMESVKSLTISKEELVKRYHFQNLHAITSHLDAGRSVVAVSGHYGNWEWGALRIGLELNEQAIVVYKPLSDKYFQKLTLAVRSRFGAALVSMKQTLRKIAEYKGRAWVLALVGDQTPTREDAHFFTTFLNQPTAVFLGAEKIAIRTDSAVVYFLVERLSRGYYSCIIEPLVEYPEETSEHEITRLHLVRLENIIRQKPEYWLWSHKRWKFKPDA